MKESMRRISSFVTSHLSLLSGNLVIGLIALVLLFFMIQSFLNYLYKPAFGEIKIVPKQKTSIDNELLKRIQQRIEKTKDAQEFMQSPSFPDPFD